MQLRKLLFNKWVFIFIFFLSCNKNDDEFTIGNEFIESDLRIILVDTITPQMSTVMLDSFSTSGTEVALCGLYSDTIFGKVTCSSYFRLGLPGSKNIVDNDIYDSISLIIKYNGYSYGDTTEKQTISVFSLTEQIDREDDNYYNVTKFNYEEISLGCKEFIPLPNTEDSIEIKLSDTFGKNLWNMIKDNSEYLESQETFLNFLPGLVLVPGIDNSAIIGIEAGESDIILRLYSHRIENTIYEFYTDLSLVNYERQFNNIQADFSETKLKQKINQQNYIDASLTNYCSFLQGGTGLVARINFPYLQDLLLLENTSLLKAELVLKPADISHLSFSLPENLSICILDKYNRIDGWFYNQDGTLVSPKFINDEFYHEQSEYSFDITNYLKNDLDDSYINPDRSFGIVLNPDDFYTSLERLVIKGGIKDTKLRLFYLFY